MSWWTKLPTTAYQANRVELGILSVLLGSLAR